MKWNHALIFVSFGIAVVAACGGTTNNPGNSDSGTSSGSSSGGTTSSGGSGGTASSGGSGGSSSSSGGASSGGTDAGSIIPPGATPGMGMVTCGGATCNAPDVCCSGGGGGGPMCQALAACNSAGNDSYTCTSKTNCTGAQICCVTFATGRGNNDVSACQTTCTGNNRAQVCLTDSECPMGTTCRGGGPAPNGTAILLCQPPLIAPGATPGTGAIACSGMTCTAPQVCCAGGGGGNTNTCDTLTGCDTGGNDSYTCTGQANCATPNVCCVTNGTGGQNNVSVCQPTCTGNNRAQVCQTSSECPTGLVCRGGGIAPQGFTTCRTPAMMMPDAGTAGGMDAAPDSAPVIDAGAPDVQPIDAGPAVDAPAGG
ncbi:MAG: hypothetical protein M3O46_21960 [Myxococcota bacterium]|nr:hypothetical protein [Myxococcota bacterium]